jgi:hypothetical protein
MSIFYFYELFFASKLKLIFTFHLNFINFA